jgi:hypothetical protein
MRVHRTAAVTALLVLTGGIAAGQETIANPEFADWSKFKKGTSVTVKVVTDAGGMKTEAVITNTLVETGPDKLVLETTSTTKAGGMEIKAPAIKRDVPKTITIPAGVKKEDLPGKDGKPPGTFEEGTETVKVAGVEYKAKWYKSKVEMAGNKFESKTWLSDEVPGRFLKGEATSTGAFASTNKMEVTEIKKP